MTILQNAYSEAMTVYENALGDVYKKDNGVFYTDLALAEKIINELKIENNPIILDPCCGTGSFIYVAQKHGYSNIYGTDKDKSAIEFCNKYISDAIIKEQDSIGSAANKTLSLLGINEKADYIVGNPPFVPISGEVSLNTDDYLFRRKVTDSGNNLFVAAIIRSLEMLKENGILAYIIPKNFLHVAAYSLLRRELLKEKTVVSIIDIGSYFKNVRGEQVIIIIKNTIPNEKSKIQLKKLSSNRFVNLISVPQNFYNDEILLFKCKEDFSIYKKLFSSYQKLEDLCKGYVGRGKSTDKAAITGKDIRKFGYKHIKVPSSGNKILIQNIYSAEAGIIAAFGGNLEAAQTVTIFTDGDEKMCRYVLGILHSRLCNLFLYKYCYNYSRLTMHTDAKYLKKIPLPKPNDENFNRILSCVSRLEACEYMEQDWFDNLELLNQSVYKAYGIDKKESDYIDCEVKCIQSKRWLKNG